MSKTDTPAKVASNDRLGQLPPCARVVEYNASKGYSFDAYTAEQMLVYGAQQVAAERERCAALCEGLREAAEHSSNGLRKAGALGPVAAFNGYAPATHVREPITGRQTPIRQTPEAPNVEANRLAPTQEQR